MGALLKCRIQMFVFYILCLYSTTRPNLGKFWGVESSNKGNFFLNVNIQLQSVVDGKLENFHWLCFLQSYKLQEHFVGRVEQFNKKSFQL